jgi:hypothetical protein
MLSGRCIPVAPVPHGDAARSATDELVLAARRFTCAAAVAALAAAGCGGGGNPTAADASIDAPPGPCGNNAVFTGENVDWDSTASDTGFCGVQGATWTVRGDASATGTTTTPPNGRFVLCVPHQAQTIVDIAPPAATSGCIHADGTPYPRRGVAIASDAVIAAGGAFSARAMTQAREAAMFTEIGAGYSATQAQLVVHVNGTPRAVSISATHAPAQQFDGTTWQAAPDRDAPVGSDVLFPNVDPGTVTITVTGGAIGPTMVSLEPDRFTYVAVIAR